MNLPATVQWECPVADCPAVLDLPANWLDTESSDPQHAGFLLVIEKQAAIDHLADHQATADFEQVHDGR